MEQKRKKEKRKNIYYRLERNILPVSDEDDGDHQESVERGEMRQRKCA